MNTMREELHRLVESLSEDELSEVSHFAKLLLKEPDELTEDEMREVEKGESEIQRGDWVRWEDIKRTDV